MEVGSKMDEVALELVQHANFEEMPADGWCKMVLLRYRDEMVGYC